MCLTMLHCLKYKNWIHIDCILISRIIEVYENYRKEMKAVKLYMQRTGGWEVIHLWVEMLNDGTGWERQGQFQNVSILSKA